MEGDSIPFEVLDGIRVIHLEALRDEVGLRPGRGSRIARLLQLLAPDEDEQFALLLWCKQRMTALKRTSWLQGPEARNQHPAERGDWAVSCTNCGLEAVATRVS